MSANRSKYIVLGCLTITLLFCLLGGTGFVFYEKATGCYNARLPLENFEFVIESSQSQQLIDQLGKFADENGFRSQMSYYRVDGKDFSVWMSRKDVEIVVRSPFELGKFEVGFYNNNCIYPTQASDIGGLIAELKGFLTEISSLRIKESK